MPTKKGWKPRRANNEKFEILLGTLISWMDIHKARAETIQEEIIAKLDVHHERMEANMNACWEGNKACLQKMKACLESNEPTPVEMVNVAVHLEGSNGTTHEETVAATDNRSRDQRLTVWRRWQPKKWIQDDGGSLMGCYKDNELHAQNNLQKLKVKKQRQKHIIKNAHVIKEVKVLKVLRGS